jgi:hypothetical protein
MADSVEYVGGPRVDSGLKRIFPLGRVEASTSRRADGTGFYDVHAGQFAFYPYPDSQVCYFAGEDVPIKVPQPVAPQAKKDAPKPLIDARKTPEPARPWKPEPPAVKPAEKWMPTPPKGH